MTRLLRLTCLAALAIAAGCSGDGNNFVLPPAGKVRVVSAITDAPALTARVTSFNLGIVSFAQATRLVDLTEGNYGLDMLYVAPDGTTVTVLNNRPLSVDAADQVTVVLLGTLAAPTVSTIRLPVPDIAAGKSEVHFVNGAMGSGALDVYLTEASVDIGGVGPTLTVNAGAATSLSTIDAGASYRLRLTAAGDPGVVYDSGSFAIESGARRMFLITDYFGPGGAGLRAVRIDSASASTFANEVLPAALRIAHFVTDEPAVDVYVDDVQTVADVAEGTLTDSLTLAPGNRAVSLTPAGEPGTVVHHADLLLGTGQARTLVVAGADGDGSVTSRAVSDTVRRIAEQAQLRVVHASPAAGRVDMHIVAPGASVTLGQATFNSLALQISGDVALEPGSYDVVFTGTGTTDIVAGPEPIVVDAEGIYSLFLADQVGGGLPGRIVLADDFLE